MARIDDLLAQVGDDQLRAQLEQAVSDLRRRKSFGLVFEEHIPETVLLPAAGVHVGSQVMMRREPADKTRYLVEELPSSDGEAVIVNGSGLRRSVPLGNLLVVKPFGEPVYPVLQAAGCLTRNADKPYHVVINGENFHALQLLLFAHEGLVDCIYIDPPYNTGARDWKYNNNYVDDQDRWRHSKWLSMMEKRLRLAKRLLKPDGVLIVTIDWREVNHLGVLLEQLFAAYDRQLITAVINSSGQPSSGLNRVEEYIYVVSPTGVQWGTDQADDLLTPEPEEGSYGGQPVRWENLLRRGTAATRAERKDMFYPIWVDPETLRIMEVGEPLPIDVTPSREANERGWVPAWPYRTDGREGRWRVGAPHAGRLLKEGFLAAGSYNAKRSSYAISYLVKKTLTQLQAGLAKVVERDVVTGVANVCYVDPHRVRPKTVWYRTRHSASEYGTAMLTSLLGTRSFSFPKSLYAVADTIRLAVGHRPDALVLDFFAGSGTTLHATALLNAEDGGKRRCILITNNEVEEKTAKAAHAKGLFAGDEEYEKHGICRAVTIPRISAAISGQDPLGQPIEGSYLSGDPFAAGFDENAAFFDLAYEDPDALEAGTHFDDIVAALWLTAGAVGDPARLHAGDEWIIAPASPFAALLDEDRLKPFIARLAERPDITHVWLVTDSEPAFARMRDRIPGGCTVGMLYRDYLRNFRINTERAR